MVPVVGYLVAFLFGAMIGSFLNVCIYRIPRNLSIVSPASRCPSCNTPIKWYDNVPLVSYLLLAGKCRVCGSAISLRYPAVELLNGLLAVFVAYRFGFALHSLIFGVLCAALIVITFIDIDYQIIPDAITLPGILLGIVAGAFIVPDPFLRSTLLGFRNSVFGFLVGGGLFYLIALVSRGGMGGGDIKMMAMVGALMGWKSVLLTIFLGSLTGAVFGIFLMVTQGKGRKTKIPFGPFLAFGTLVTLFFGQEISIWYFSR